MTRIRRLHHPDTGKTWGTRTDGLNVIVTSGAPGKERETVKLHADAASMARFLDKEERARLRKGFVLTNPDAGAGEPVMLCMLAGGYTGALAVAEHRGKLLVNRYDDSKEGDCLWAVDAEARAEMLFSVGRHRLVWKLIPAPKLERVLFLADHQVMSRDADSNAMVELTAQNDKPVSTLDCAGTIVAWYEQHELIVRDLAAGENLFRLEVQPELCQGSFQLACALSPDGAMLAYCAKPGEIRVHSVSSGVVQATLSGGFGRVGKLAFAPDGRLIVNVNENFGRKALFAVELGSEVLGSEVLGPRWPDPSTPGPSEFAIDPVRNLIAFHERGHVDVYDLATAQKRGAFTVDHAVKKVGIAWTSDGLLAFHTDLGCVGLYRV